MSPLDLEAVRRQFPALASGFVFLDNAGGSQTLGRVADRVRDYLLTTNVQLGASYRVSAEAGERVQAAASVAARLLGSDDEGEVVIGPSTTQLVNNLAQAIAGQLTAGDEIVVSEADHHANVGPWRRLGQRGVVVRTWPIDRTSWRLEERDLLPLLGPRTRLVAFTHASNLLGTIHDVPRLTRLVHQHGARVCVDGVAYAPHRAIEVRRWDVDYYLLSFYKVYAPHLAVLYGKREALERLDSINHPFLGGVLPYKLQPGNVNFELCHGLGGLEEYLESLGGRRAAFAAFAAHEERLAARLLGYLRQRRGVRLHGEAHPDAGVRVPTVSFSLEGGGPGTPERVVRGVDPAGIGIRHGDFYARELVAALGLLDRGGVVRVSMVHYNTEAEIDRLIAALDPAIEAALRDAA